MKNFIKIFLQSLLILSIFTTISCAATKREITSVAVTGIDAPYSESRVLDTNGEVGKNATYRIIEVSWKTPGNSSSGFYEVSVTLKADYYYKFSDEEITATINNNAITPNNIELLDEDELRITYAFTNDDPATGTIGNGYSTLRYRILVYCNKEQGQITPSLIRILKGKSQTITITPNEGYKIKDVKVDGESVGAVSEYTFKKVKESHTVRAYFEKIEETEDDDDTIVDENITFKPILSFIITVLELCFAN